MTFLGNYLQYVAQIFIVDISSFVEQHLHYLIMTFQVGVQLTRVGDGHRCKGSSRSLDPHKAVVEPPLVSPLMRA